MGIVAASATLGAAGPGSGAAAATTAAPAAAASTDPITLTYQTPFVVPQPTGGTGGTFDLQLSLGAAVGPLADVNLQVALYPHLTSRSALEQAISTPPSGATIDHTQAIPAICLSPGTRGGLDLPVTISTSSATAGTVRCAATGANVPTAVLGLGCSPGTCSGVYPVEVTATRGSGETVAHLTTFLTYAEAKSATPLDVAVVLPVHDQVTATSAKDAVTLVATTPASVTAVGQELADLRAASGVPVTLQVVPQTVQALAASSSSTARQAFDDLATLAATPTVHEIPANSYVSVDLSALAAGGLTSELVAQLTRGSEVLGALGIHLQAGPGVGGAGTWIATSPNGPSLGAGLSAIGADHVVVSDTDLASASENNNETWSQPFGLSLPKGVTVTAAAADSELTSDFTAGPADPVLAASDLLADLAFVHYEAPNASAQRGLVAAPPADWNVDPTFVATLLAGLSVNPNVQPVTLDSFFSSVPEGGNGAPTTRHLNDTATGSTLSGPLVAQLAQGRERLAAFSSAVVKSAAGTAELTLLEELLLTAESSDLRTGAQAGAVANFERALGTQLDQVQLAADRTITLTARTAPIPITIVSSAPYVLEGTLSLVSDKLTFPSGNTQTMVLNHNTNAARLVVQARTTGDLPLHVILSTPQGGLTIVSGQVTVRSTASSLAGIVLTLVAAAVLGAWWIRTWRRSRRTRHAEDA
jgi:Family of unknown function (DUF6049)